MVDTTASNNFLENGPRADIACDILCPLGQAGHEALPAGIVESRAKREKSRRGEQARHWPAQYYGVVLHKFHIHQVYPGTQCHGHTIPSDAGDVRRLGIHLAAPPRSE